MSGTLRRVLVVDDNTDAANTIADLLKGAGHTVEIAYDGPSAIQKGLRLQPEFVFLDLGLPGVDGFVVAARLRLEPSLRGARIIAVTAYAGDDMRQKATEAGFDDYLVKPVEPRFIESLLGSRPGSR